MCTHIYTCIKTNTCIYVYIYTDVGSLWKYILYIILDIIYCSYSIYADSYLLLMFIYLFLKGWGEGQRDRERIPSRLLTISTEPKARLKLMNRKIMT